MNTLLLGGQSLRNQEWTDALAARLKSGFDRVLVLQYLHWKNGDEPNIETEVRRVTQLASQLVGEYVVVAKSFGTIVSALAISQGKLKPIRCVYMGFPFNGISSVTGVDEAVAALPPTTFLQNEHDPWGDAEAVKKYLSEYGNAQLSLVMQPGDTHEYLDLEKIAELASGN